MSQQFRIEEQLWGGYLNIYVNKPFPAVVKEYSPYELRENIKDYVHLNADHSNKYTVFFAL